MTEKSLVIPARVRKLFLIFWSCSIALLGSPLDKVLGQAPSQESLLPNPHLLTVVPPGAKRGTTVEVTFTGTDLEEPQALFFSHPGIRAEPVRPPSPPKDPKKPAVPQAPVTSFKVSVAPDTPLGNHDIRFVNKWGISNPRVFVVGELPEVLEKEPNNDVSEAQRVALNTTINGAIASPTDVDYFVFQGRKGQRVLVSCLSTTIDSRLDPALELYDTAGRQLGFNRRYQGSDALLDCTLPRDGDYFIRLYEFTHLVGSGEYFYRLTLSTLPWIDAVYPPVVELGKPTQVTVFGRNLPHGIKDPKTVVEGKVLEKITTTVTPSQDPQGLIFSGRLPPASSALDGFEYRIRNEVGSSNPFLLTYARGPIVLDNEANDTPETSQVVPVPCEIAGRIEKRRDRDWYTFNGKKGQVLWIELFSQRLGAQTDMNLILRNQASKQTMGEYDDDSETLSPVKFFTSSTDPPRHRFEVPADGNYQIQVKSQDGDMRAGVRQFYRVSITPEKPDFRLVAMPPADHNPDACQLRQGGRQFFTVFVWRLDQWEGAIELTAEGLPSGVTCPPQTIGPGLKQALLVLTASPNAAPGIQTFRLKGTGLIRGKAVVREARAASVTWPVSAQQVIPGISRLDRELVFAVREKAPYDLQTSTEHPWVIQGDKVKLSLKLARLWPDFKTPLQAAPVDFPSGLTVNNNQPITIGSDKTDGSAVINASNSVAPGTYNLVFRGLAQVPFNKDPVAKQKTPLQVVQPSSPMALTVLPKQVANLSVTTPTLTIKAGNQGEVIVKVQRMFEFSGEFKIKLILPPQLTGISASEATILTGKDEAKFLVKIDNKTAPGNRPDLVVRATATLMGKVPTVHETKISLNVVK